MQRAMQTAIHMFKNHPNLPNIKFIVLPILREVLETSNDIAWSINDMMEKYKSGNEFSKGLNFDFSPLFMYGNPELW
jgi:hypothetical protein